MVFVQMHRGGGLFSRLIRWFTRAGYSHVSLWFWDAADPHGGAVVEAMEGKGVREIPADWYREARGDGRITVYTMREPLTLVECEALLSAVRAEVGAKYDWLGVFRFVTRRRHAHNDKWFCSELVAWGFAQIGRPLFDRTEAWEVKPGDIPRSPHLIPTGPPFGPRWSVA
jgi:uncharacterized protein YycO